MTPAEERALLDQIGQRIESAVDVAYAEFVAAMSKGDTPREAALGALDDISTTIGEQLAAGLSSVTGKDASLRDALALSLGGRTVEQTMDDTRQEVATVVQGLKDQHDAQFAALRAAAEQLFNSYKP